MTSDHQDAALHRRLAAIVAGLLLLALATAPALAQQPEAEEQEAEEQEAEEQEEEHDFLERRIGDNWVLPHEELEVPMKMKTKSQNRRKG